MISRHRSIMESERLATHCVAWLIVLLLAALASQLLGFPNSNGDRKAIVDDEFTTPIAAGQVGGTYSTGGQLRTVTDTYASVNLVANGGFEVLGAGSPDIFGSWTETATSWGTSVIAEGNGAGEYHGGTNALKMTMGDTALEEKYTLTTIVGYTYTLSFWTRGDATVGGRYKVGTVIGDTATGVMGTDYVQITTNFVANATSTIIYLYTPTAAGTAYYDDVTVYPTTGLCSVEDGKLKFAGGKASPEYGDPGVYWPAVTRQDGLTMRGIINREVAATTINTFGFDADITGLPAVSISLRTSSVIAFLDTANVTIGAFLAATYYPISVQAGASKWFAYISESGIWKLKYISFLKVSDTTLYPTFANYSAAATLDNLDVRIRPLPVPLASDSFDRADGALGSTDGTGHAERNGGANAAWVGDLGTWAISGNTAVSSALGSTSAVATVSAQTGNVLAMAKLTRSAGNVGIVLRYNSETNHIFCIHDGTNGNSYKVVDGVLTQVGTTAATYAAAANMMVIADGAEVRLYYNNAFLHAYSTYTDASINDKPKVGLYTTDTGNSFNNFVVYARGNEGQYSYMGDRR